MKKIMMCMLAFGFFSGLVSWSSAVTVEDVRVESAGGRDLDIESVLAYISLRPGDKTVLKPGMTIHLMPGIWQDDFGFENSEPFLVTETGCETLCSFPRQIFTR